MNLKGHIFRKYVPFLPGVRSVKCIEERAPKEGEYFLHGTVVVKRVGFDTLSKAEQQRKFWIVEILEKS